MNRPEKPPKELPPRMIDAHPIAWLFVVLLLFFVAFAAVPLLLWLAGSALPVR